MTEEKKPGKFASWIERTKIRAISIWEYCAEGVWEDQRDTAKVNIVKTLNLTVRSFMDSDLQSSACALTYRTMLAVVPALALLLQSEGASGFRISSRHNSTSIFHRNTAHWKWHSLS